MAASVERSAVVDALPRKGLVHRSGTKHDIFRLEIDGKETTIFTKVSRGTKYKVLGPSLVSAMSKQLHLSKGEFLDLVKCKIDHSGYVAILRRKGELK